MRPSIERELMGRQSSPATTFFAVLPRVLSWAPSLVSRPLRPRILASFLRGLCADDFDAGGSGGVGTGPCRPEGHAVRRYPVSEHNVPGPLSLHSCPGLRAFILGAGTPSTSEVPNVMALSCHSDLRPTCFAGEVSSLTYLPDAG